MKININVSRLRCAAALLFLAGLALPEACRAQTDDNAVPLGDVARALRKEKEKTVEAPTAETVIDNENFNQIMQDAETERLKGDVRVAFEGSGSNVHVAAPDVTCSLAFNAQSGALLSDPFAPEDVPRSELGKLDGPAAIHGDLLQVTVYNGSRWTIKEITVGLTILRREGEAAALGGPAKLLPAAETGAATEKRSDLTVLFHIKGSAAPSTTTVFHQSLGVALDPEQDWHWAIVQAKGIPPR